ETGAEIDRTQGVVAKTAHVRGAAGEEILEERQPARTVLGDHGRILAVVDAGPVNAAVAAAITDRCAAEESELAGDRNVLRIEVVELEIFDRRAGQGRFEGHRLERATCRVVELVARVVGPGKLETAGVEGVVIQCRQIVDELLRGGAAERGDAGPA